MSSYYKNVVLLANSNEKFKEPKDVMLGARMSNNESVRRRIPASSQPTNGAAGTVRFEYTFPTGNVESVPMLEAELTLELTNTAGLDPISSLYGKIGVRQLALNRLINNAKVEFNGHEFNSRPSDVAECFANSQPLSQLMRVSDAPAGQLSTKFDSSILNNSLREGANAVDTVSSNGLGNNWDVVSITRNGANDYEIKLIYREVVFAQPFQYQEPNPIPFRNLNDFKAEFDMNALTGQVGEFLVVDDAHAQAGTTVACTASKFNLLVHTWNPSLNPNIPKQIVYNAPEVVRLASKAQALTVGAGPAFAAVPAVVSSGSFVLNSVPTALFIFAKRNKAANGLSYEEADQYANITKLSIDTAQKTDIFNNYTQHQLYEMSVKNGYNERYAKFAQQEIGIKPAGADPVADPAVPKHGAGSVIIIKPSDIPAASQQSFISHANKTFTMEVRATMKCPSGSAAGAGTYTLKVMAYYDDLVLYNEDDNGTYKSMRPLISGEELARAPVVYAQNKVQNNHIVGGSWWGDMGNRVWSGLTWLGNMLRSPEAKTLSRTLRNSGLAPVVADGTPFGNLASEFGYGKKKKATKKRKGGDLLEVGSGTKGGKKMSKAQLKKLLDKM